MYTIHPSAQLNNKFRHKPYQGAEPSQASFLFIGLDANYDAHIETNPIFQKVIDYHDDAVNFWQENGVHHPFLLPKYSGDGKFYHRSFARIGFCPEHANLVSFVELLHVPTVGRNKLVASDFNVEHLKMLNTAIIEGKAKFIFIPASVVRLMHLTNIFPWLAKKPIKSELPLGILYRNQTKIVFTHLHFSTYGKFEQLKIQEAEFISSLIASMHQTNI